VRAATAAATTTPTDRRRDPRHAGRVARCAGRLRHDTGVRIASTFCARGDSPCPEGAESPVPRAPSHLSRGRRVTCPKCADRPRPASQLALPLCRPRPSSPCAAATDPTSRSRVVAEVAEEAEERARDHRGAIVRAYVLIRTLIAHNRWRSQVRRFLRQRQNPPPSVVGRGSSPTMTSQYRLGGPDGLADDPDAVPRLRQRRRGRRGGLEGSERADDPDEPTGAQLGECSGEKKIAAASSSANGGRSAGAGRRRACAARAELEAMSTQNSRAFAVAVRAAVGRGQPDIGIGDQHEGAAQPAWRR
jgi:hypothetical protein